MPPREADPELARLGDRFATLLGFVERFDRGVEIFVRGDARAIEGVFTALALLDDATVDRLWASLASSGPRTASGRRSRLRPCHRPRRGG